MKKKNYKGRCVKRAVPKSKEICKTYNDIQFKFLDVLQESEQVKEIMCNVPIVLSELGEYTTDFLYVKSNGEYSIRECVYRKHISKPLTTKLLDASRKYWLTRGITDWGIVLDAEE